jgi:hypothetical protein
VALTPFTLHIAMRSIDLSVAAFLRPLLPMAITAAASAGLALAVDLAIRKYVPVPVELLAGLIVSLGLFALVMFLWRPPAVQDLLLTVRNRVKTA